MIRLLFPLLLVSSICFAGQKAVTDSGEVVILNEDGSWRYENQSRSGQSDTKIPTNNTRFSKPKASSFQLKSKATNLGLWINTEKWKFAKKGSLNSDAEFELQHRKLDLYGIVITEAVEIKLENLAEIALSTMQDSMDNLIAVTKEYRVVNDQKVIYMEANALVSGMKATYLGYYYSNSQGSYQVLVYTGTNLVDKYRSEIYDLLNGFVVR
jgi:hypothetical protein